MEADLLHIRIMHIARSSLMVKDVHGLCEQTVWLHVYDLVYVLLQACCCACRNASKCLLIE